MMCISAIARKTPPLNAFATLSAIGDSLNLELKRGIDPIPRASKNAIITKPIFTVYASTILKLK
jgi:hypothetical protein